MKKRIGLLTTLLASAIGVATFGGVCAFKADADESTVTYSPAGVFSTSSDAKVGADETDKTKTAFTFGNGASVSYKKDLAFKWYENKTTPCYLDLKFTLDGNFEKYDFEFEAGSYTAAKDDKVKNTVTFEKRTEGTFAYVNGDSDAAQEVAANNELEMSLTDGTKDGEFDLLINGVKIGTFTNIGASYAANSSTVVPLKITAHLPENATEKSVMLFSELNKQSFELNPDTGNLKEDNAVPVLVVNDDVTSFVLGSQFALDYKTIDVLDSTVTSEMKYYQYNPTDTDELDGLYKTLTTSTYFFDTVYENDLGKKTSVYKEEGKEYVSVRFQLKDDAHTDKTTYELAWYAEASVSKTVNSVAVDFVPAERNTEGPKYVGAGTLSTLVPEYQTLLDEAAKDVSAGEGSYLYFPLFKGFITDNDTGYKNLKFTICYKKPSSSSSLTSSGLTYSNLKLSVDDEGTYEFKIFATDKAGNIMKATDNNGLEVVVSNDNIWDIDEIPSFTFNMKYKGMTIEDNSTDRKGSGLIDVKYTADDFDVKGFVGERTYVLYYFDIELFESRYPEANISTSLLSSIPFDKLNGAITLEEVANKYATAIAELFDGITANDLFDESKGNAILREIGEYDANYTTENYADNVYEWKSSERSFMPVTRGTYVMLGLFTDSEFLDGTVSGYKAITVEDSQDVNPGESEWFKNNKTSVILFSIAGVLLICIIVLLFVKPSDEKLEDVDTKGKKEKKNETVDSAEENTADETKE